MIRDPGKIHKKVSKIARESGRGWRERERGGRLRGKEPWLTINFEASRRDEETSRGRDRGWGRGAPRREDLHARTISYTSSWLTSAINQRTALPQRAAHTMPVILAHSGSMDRRKEEERRRRRMRRWAPSLGVP